MYTVKKISINRRLADRSPFYECVLRYPRWSDLVADMHRRDKSNSVVLLQSGSDIFKDDERMGNTLILLNMPGPIKTITLAEFKEWHQ